MKSLKIIWFFVLVLTLTVFTGELKAQ